MDNQQLRGLIQDLIQGNNSIVERLFEVYPTANDLLLANQDDLQRIKGITRQRAIQLYSAFQMAKELHRPREPTFVRCPKDVFDLLATDLRFLNQEHFVCIFLNTKNRVIDKETLAIGTLNATIVHPREVFRAAINRSCASIICVHNHPSGDPTPSQEDIQITERLIAAGNVVGIDMLDHVVIGGESFFSMREQGVV